MKLEILKEHLEQIVQVVGKVSNKNLSLPVLGCVLLTAKDGRTSAKATNLDVSVELNLKAKIIEDGEVAIPAHILTQAITTATDQKLSLSSDGTTLKIKELKGVANIKTIDTADFPTLPFVKEGEGVSVSVPTKDVARAFKLVSFAASSSGMRPELSSVFLTLDNGMFVTAATDSFRLAESKIPTKTKINTDPTLIPARNTNDIVRTISNSDTTEIRIGENQITFISDGSYITSRTIDGAFPQYQAIIPETFATTATMLTEDALRAMRKVSVFVDASSQVGLHVNVENKTLSVEAKNTQVGETEELIEAALEGDPIDINFNVRYLLDALPVISSDSVVFKIAGPGKPMVLSDVPDKGFTYLVMPMNK